MLTLERVLLTFPKMDHNGINKATRATFTVERRAMELVKSGKHRIFFTTLNESKACTPLVECVNRLSVTVNKKSPLTPPRKKPLLDEYFGYDISDMCTLGINEVSLVQKDCCCVRPSLTFICWLSYLQICLLVSSLFSCRPFPFL